MAKRQVNEKVGAVKTMLGKYPIEKDLRELLDADENMNFSLSISGTETTLTMSSNSTTGGERESYTHTLPLAVVPTVPETPEQ